MSTETKQSETVTIDKKYATYIAKIIQDQLAAYGRHMDKDYVEAYKKFLEDCK
jgi:hypothetical protein